MLSVPSAMIGGPFLVNYTIDFGGTVKDVWVLTPAEAAVQPWPTTTLQAQSLVLRPDCTGLDEAVTDAVKARPLVYIKTFGCQMNVYDSARHGRCAARGRRLRSDHRHRGRRPDPLQHLLGAREGRGKGVQRSRAASSI